MSVNLLTVKLPYLKSLSVEEIQRFLEKWDKYVIEIDSLPFDAMVPEVNLKVCLDVAIWEVIVLDQIGLDDDDDVTTTMILDHLRSKVSEHAGDGGVLRHLMQDALQRADLPNKDWKSRADAVWTKFREWRRASKVADLFEDSRKARRMNFSTW